VISEKLGRLAAALAVAATLALGIGAPAATAADPPDPPEIREVSAAPPLGIRFTWFASGTKPIDGVRLTIYQSNAFLGFNNTPAGGARSGFVAFQSGTTFKPDTRYCVGLVAYVGTGATEASTFSEESERRCFTMPPREGGATAPNPAPPPPPPPPTKPDLMVTRVSGPADVFDGVTAVYEVVLANDGTAAQGTAQVQINAAGPIEPEEMAETPDGFACDLGDLGFSCTGSLGGVDDPIQERVAIFKVRMRGNGTGAATVIGSANHFGALDEMTVDNNLKLLQVTVK